MSEFGMFHKKLNGFHPGEVLEYIEFLQKEKFAKETELLEQIEKLTQEKENLSLQLEEQSDRNQQFQEKLSECEKELASVSQLAEEYAKEARKAVSALHNPVTVQKLDKTPGYQVSGKSKFDTIKEKLSSINSVIEETKKYFFK